MRRWLNYIGGVLILGVIVFAIYPFVPGEDRMERFCAAVGAGDLRRDVLARAAAAGYAVKDTEAAGIAIVLIIDTRAMGRYICEVSVENGAVRGARYVSND